MTAILVVNAGSSSIKVTLFSEALEHLLSGSATEIGGTSVLSIDGESRAVTMCDHADAFRQILAALEARGIAPGDLTAAGHRVVHGGRTLLEPRLLTDDVTAEIEACVPLAPLHNPHNLTAIRALAAVAPGLAQYASFDTAFHATNPDVALCYALPAGEDAKGIRRYGFHGISYAGLVRALPELSGAPLPKRLLACHLGNGVSLCAIRDGQSVATTMGYSPLDGLTMGTRTGAIDGNAVLRLAQDYGIDGAADLLNRKSGLLGLGGMSDMRALHAAGTDEARFAIEHFCYWATRHAGSMIAAMDGLDAIAFTGGIGENDWRVRAAIMARLEWLGLRFDASENQDNHPRLHAGTSRVSAWIVPADEERVIAGDALAVHNTQ